MRGQAEQPARDWRKLVGGWSGSRQRPETAAGAHLWRSTRFHQSQLWLWIWRHGTAGGYEGQPGMVAPLALAGRSHLRPTRAVAERGRAPLPLAACREYAGVEEAHSSHERG